MHKDVLSRSIDATDDARLEAGRLERFLAEPSPRKALALWFEGESLSRERIIGRLTWEIARIDELLSRQTNAILHHPRFQALEASWRGLSALCEESEDAEGVKVRVLDLSWAELVKDVERAIEFDQTHLFRQVYTQEFDMPGGEPFGVLLGDYALRHRPTRGHPTDDLGVLSSVAETAAASFSPFLAAVEPGFFGLDELGELERPMDLERIFQAPEYTKWNALQKREDARFVGLLLPRVLRRTPYGDFTGRQDGFRFRETIARREDYLFGNPVYAMGSVLIRTFAEVGWLAGIRGVERDVLGGGLVTDLPVESYPTDRAGLVAKPSTEFVISDRLERSLADLGFLPLCHCPGTDLAAFHSTPSIQRPRRLEDPAANVNARISGMLNYVFCVSRFAHYIKVMGREAIGAFRTPVECERHLNEWLRSYTTANAGTSGELQARYPLRDARVQVNEVPGKPGVFSSVIHLQPHFQLDQMTTSITLVTELPRGLE